MTDLDRKTLLLARGPQSGRTVVAKAEESKFENSDRFQPPTQRLLRNIFGFAFDDEPFLSSATRAGAREPENRERFTSALARGDAPERWHLAELAQSRPFHVE